ncbi:MAG TPA: hypothetical protein VGD43_18395, partial [Micromonospora sp.]
MQRATATDASRTSTPDGAAPADPAPDRGGTGPRRPSVPAWPSLPPLQRTVTGDPSLTAPARFTAGLTAWRDP